METFRPHHPSKHESNMESFDVIICGSGPAGLAAGLAAASHGASTVILDPCYVAGRKLCATGNGRCNFSNTLPPLKFMAEFGRHGRFMADALREGIGWAELIGGITTGS